MIVMIAIGFFVVIILIYVYTSRNSEDTNEVLSQSYQKDVSDMIKSDTFNMEDNQPSKQEMDRINDLMDFEKPFIRFTKTDSEGGKRLIYRGVIESINNEIKSNQSGTEFYVTKVNVIYPNGEKAVVGSVLYLKEIISRPDVFRIDNEIEIAVTLEGKYKGRSTVIPFEDFSEELKEKHENRISEIIKEGVSNSDSELKVANDIVNEGEDEKEKTTMVNAAKKAINVIQEIGEIEYNNLKILIIIYGGIVKDGLARGKSIEELIEQLFKMYNLTSTITFSNKEMDYLTENYKNNLPVLITILYSRLGSSNLNVWTQFNDNTEGMFVLVWNIYNKEILNVSGEKISYSIKELNDIKEYFNV